MNHPADDGTEPAGDERPPADRAPEQAPEADPRWGIGPAVVGLIAGVVVASVAAATVAAATDAPEDGLSLPVLAASLIGLWATYGAVAFWLSRTRGSGDVAADVGLRFRSADMGWGVAGALVSAFILVPVLYALLVALGLLDADVLREELDDPARRIGGLADGPAYVVILLLVGLGAPLAEEVYFRGVLQPAVVRRTGPAAGIAITAVVFGLAHPGQALQWPGLILFGAVLGWLAQRAGRLGPAIVAHVVFNTLTLVQLALT